MTVREWAETYCTNRGMTPEHAGEIVAAVMADDPDPDKGWWDDDMTSYPETFVAALTLNTRSAALRWFNANPDLSWCRRNFALPSDEDTR